MPDESAEAREVRLGATFYHVTTRERLASILEHGFDPRFSRTGNGMLYLTLDLAHALAYAAHHGDAASAVVLQVPGHALDPACLGPDDVDLPDLLDEDDDWTDHDWLSSQRISGQVAYEGTVPADVLTGRPCPEGEPAGDWLALPALAEACPVPAAATP